jgi:hypothetical protein
VAVWPRASLPPPLRADFVAESDWRRDGEEGGVVVEPGKLWAASGGGLASVVTVPSKNQVRVWGVWGIHRCRL